jgi:hypothetical protein
VRFGVHFGGVHLGMYWCICLIYFFISIFVFRKDK